MGYTIIGRGEVGRVFERAASQAGETVRLIVRGDRLSERLLDQGPIIVAVREEDLEGVLESLRSACAERIVLVQNGDIDPLLVDVGRVTRGLLWFTAKGELFKVLAPSPFFGPLAPEIVDRLSRAGVAAEVLEDEGALRREVVMKLAFNNVVGLPLAVHALSLGEYLAQRREEARAVVTETCAAMSAALGVHVDADAAFARFLETTRELGSLRGGKKALAFRNGAVVRWGRQHGIDVPVNRALLEAANPS